MIQNPPPGMPQICPYLIYADVKRALVWLADVFGFEKRFELPNPEGEITHAEMTLGTGVIMLGPPCDERGTRPPGELNGASYNLFVYVDDVDAHYRHAKEHGAVNIGEPVDVFWGDRIYSAQDCEGHHWTFAQCIKKIPPEEMKLPWDEE